MASGIVDLYAGSPALQVFFSLEEPISELRQIHSAVKCRAAFGAPSLPEDFFLLPGHAKRFQRVEDEAHPVFRNKEEFPYDKQLFRRT